MKKALIMLLVAVGLFGCLSNVSAQRVSFSITTSKGSSWAYDYSNLSINDTNKYSGVGWETSNRGNHTMWFGVFNTSFLLKGKLLFNSKKLMLG